MPKNRSRHRTRTTRMRESEKLYFMELNCSSMAFSRLSTTTSRYSRGTRGARSLT